MINHRDLLIRSWFWSFGRVKAFYQFFSVPSESLLLLELMVESGRAHRHVEEETQKKESDLGTTLSGPPKML